MNMMIYIKKLITLVVVVFSLQLSGQELLTKNDAVHLALENNYGIKIANNNVQIANNNKSILNSGYLPTLIGNASADYRNASSNSEFEARDPIDVSGAVSKTYNASAGIGYLLFNGFARKNLFKSLKEQFNLSELQARQIIENTVTTLFFAYYEVARLKQNEAIQKNNLDLSQQRFKRANYGYEYGQNSRLDILNAQVDMNNDSIAYLNSKLLLTNAKRDLNVVLGRSVNTKLEVTTDVDYILGLNLDDLIQKAQQKNVTILQAQKNIELGKYDIKISKGGYMPNVSLTSSYAWNKSDNEPVNPFSPINSVQTSLNAGIGLSWDIFDGGQTKTRVKNAKIALENLEIQNTQAVEILERDLRNAWETYQNSLYTLEVQRTNLATNQLNFDRSTDQFKLGRITTIEYRQAQVNLNLAELNLNQAKYNAKNAELAVIQLAGILLENNIY